MLEPRNSLQEISFQVYETSFCHVVSKPHARQPQLGQREPRELQRAGVVFRAALVVDGQLLASMYAILRVSGNFLPQRRGARVVAAALGMRREFASRLRAEFGG